MSVQFSGRAPVSGGPPESPKIPKKSSYPEKPEIAVLRQSPVSRDTIRFSNPLEKKNKEEPGSPLTRYPTSEGGGTLVRASTAGTYVDEGETSGGADTKSPWRSRAQTGTKVAADYLEDLASWVYLDAVLKGPANAWKKPFTAGVAWGTSGFTRFAHHLLLPPKMRDPENLVGSFANGLAGVGNTVAPLLSKQGARQTLVIASQQTANACWALSGGATIYNEAKLWGLIGEGHRDSGDRLDRLAITQSAVRTTGGFLQVAASAASMAGKDEVSAICWGLGSTCDTVHTTLAGLACLMKWVKELPNTA